RTLGQPVSVNTERRVVRNQAAAPEPVEDAAPVGQRAVTPRAQDCLTPLARPPAETAADVPDREEREQRAAIRCRRQLEQDVGDPELARRRLVGAERRTDRLECATLPGRQSRRPITIASQSSPFCLR